MTDTLLPSAVAGLTYQPEAIEAELVCTAVRDETHDVKTIVLARDSAEPLAFLPGQYLTVTVEVDGEQLQRCYSIASASTGAAEVSLTVKRTAGGPVSSWLHDHLQPGDRLQVAGPFGVFSHAVHPAEKYLLLSAGSGITPVMSMLRTLAHRGEAADVVFVHSARTPADIIFRHELEQLATLPGCSVTVVCESELPDEAWSGPTGLLSLRTLLTVAPDAYDREVFTCGPPGYMRAVRDLLELAAVDPERCHEENFDLAARAGDTVDDGVEPPAGGERYAVRFLRSERTVECHAGETILAAARRHGLPLPSMCTQGMCGTCLTSLVEGQVDMQHAGGISRRQVDEGKILACCSRPLGDVTLDA